MNVNEILKVRLMKLPVAVFGGFGFCCCFFVIVFPHCEINARATNKSGEKLTVAGFWGGFWFGSQQEVIEAIPSMTTKACS